MQTVFHVSSELTGIFPRSEALVAATRDLDRRRVSASHVAGIRHTQQTDLVRFQKNLGMSPLSDGMLNWQDIFRPFTILSSGVASHTLTRYADSNTFFKQPKVTGALRFRPAALREFFTGIHTHGSWKATLPAPLFFARVADDRHYHSLKKLALAFTDVLVHMIRTLSKSSYTSFQLYDPYLGYQGAGSAEIELVRQTTQKLVTSAHKAIGYQIVFSSPRRAITALLTTDCEAIGVDFFNTDIASLPSFGGTKTLIAGCVDSRTSLIEQPKVIAQFVRRAMTHIKPKRIVLTSNDDMQFVPVDIAKKKLRVLHEAISLLK